MAPSLAFALILDAKSAANVLFCKCCIFWSLYRIVHEIPAPWSAFSLQSYCIIHHNVWYLTQRHSVEIQKPHYNLSNVLKTVWLFEKMTLCSHLFSILSAPIFIFKTSARLSTGLSTTYLWGQIDWFQNTRNTSLFKQYSLWIS